MLSGFVVKVQAMGLGKKTILLVGSMEPSMVEQGSGQPGSSNLVTAANAGDAMVILESRKVDVAIVDHEYGRERGAKLIAWIRRAYPSVATVLVGGAGPVELALEADRCDAAACLAKPFTVERLRSVLIDLLRS